MGRVNTVFNGELIYKMARTINLLIDEIDDLRSKVDDLEFTLSKINHHSLEGSKDEHPEVQS